jgi:hypothetical protein
MRRFLHKAICWYLRRCGGAFHCYSYGENGRYVKLMTEREYALHAKSERIVFEILNSHGAYGDGSNLDKFTRSKCLEFLQTK